MNKHNYTSAYYRGQNEYGNFPWSDDINYVLWYSAGESNVRIVKKKGDNSIVLPIYPPEKAVELYEPIKELHQSLEKYIPLLYTASLKKHEGSHAYRVIRNALIIGNLIGLRTRQLELLALAALYHDSGRKNDRRAVGHGKRSAILFQQTVWKYDFPMRTLSKSEVDIVKSIISLHEIEDKEAIPILKKQWNSYVKIKLFCILKDADALDRYRFQKYRRHFDYHYLRTDEAKRLPLVTAWQFEEDQKN